MAGFDTNPENINTNGRPKGSPNKTTQEIRDAYKLFVDKNVDLFQEWIERVAENNPAKALELVRDCSEFILPKLNRTEAIVEVKEKTDLSNVSPETLEKLHNELNETDSSEGET